MSKYGKNWPMCVHHLSQHEHVLQGPSVHQHQATRRPTLPPPAAAGGSGYLDKPGKGLLHHLLVSQSIGAQNQIECSLGVGLGIQHATHGLHRILQDSVNFSETAQGKLLQSCPRTHGWA